MRSAEPMYHSGRPSLAKLNMRECSRYWPTIERTRIPSLTPGTPGQSEQIPRIRRSTWTPAWAAPYSAATQAGSTSELSLRTIRAGLPARAWLASRSIIDRIQLRRFIGATIRRRKSRWRDRPVRTLNRSLTSAPSSGRHDSRPRSVYSLAVPEL